MKKFTYLVAVIVIATGSLFTSLAQSSNNECKVLLEPISETYSGDCKNGLAHGNGKANGIDEYTGEFKAGLPDGKGKYVWANGNYYDGNWKDGRKDGKGEMFLSAENKTISGKWKNDAQLKSKSSQYKIIRTVNLNNILIKKNLNEPAGTVEIVFRISKGKDYFSTIELTSNSGYVVKTDSYVAFKDVKFPFKGEVSFVISGTHFIIHERCILEFEILEESSWKVYITHND